MTHAPTRGMAAIAAVLSLSTACADRPISSVEPETSKENRTTFPIEINRNVDILFVIDNSGSMDAEQVSITTNFQRMIEELEMLDGGLPNVHIAVVSTDVGAGSYQGCRVDGDDGSFQSQPRIAGCSGPQGAFLIDVDDGNGGRSRNYQGQLADAFACVAKLGIQGCGFEQPLESMRRALDGNNPMNAGFLRPDALLAVVFLTDEDDCSASSPLLFGDDPSLGPLSSYRCFEYGITCDGPSDPRAPGPRENCRANDDSLLLEPIDEYIAFLRGTKRFESQLLVAAITGDDAPVVVSTTSDGAPELEPSCNIDASDEKGADPPIRMARFLAGFSQNDRSRVCDGDLSGALKQIGQLIVRGLEGACVPGDLADTSDEPGIQPECEVSELGTDPAATPTRLPRCNNPSTPNDSTNLPCYSLEEDTAKCGHTPTALRVSVHYPDGTVKDPQTLIDARCLAP